MRGILRTLGKCKSNTYMFYNGQIFERILHPACCTLLRSVQKPSIGGKLFLPSDSCANSNDGKGVV